MQENKFKIQSKYSPTGDQPKAIASLLNGIKKGFKHQTLLGVTGSGKTYTAANIIQNVGKPTLVIAHNKTLAAQLAQEYREFFPDNAVHYFVSYYDYYQPEAYMSASDTYIEKEAQINEEIERLRHASTQALLTRKDVIIVSSVSCIYGLGSPKEYEKVNLRIDVGQKISRNDLARKFIDIHFERTTADLSPGQFRALGNTVEVMPVSERVIFKIDFKGDEIFRIFKVDAVTRGIIEELSVFFLFPAKHFITDEAGQKRAIASITSELNSRLKELEKEGKVIEHERLKRRAQYDLAMIREVGYCNGIENYSRHFSDKKAGEAPETLLSYFPHKADGTPDFLTIIDESHVTVSQIGGMYAGDASRKKNLIDYGFRLPSAADNRPLKFPEFEERVGQVIYTSATPGVYEKEHSENVAEQVIRPTGLIDPEIFVRPVTAVQSGKLKVVSSGTKKNSKEFSTSEVVHSEPSTLYPGQIRDFIAEAEKTIKNGWRVIATTLTKKMAEDLSEFLKEKNIKAEYLHSDIMTLDRIQILTEFRKGKFDVLVGVNLLREGLDLPEVALIGILDADKEGFLRSETSLIQIIGRAARNVEGKVIAYADNMTRSLESAIRETNRRRGIQVAYNTEHGITPKTILKNIKDITETIQSERKRAVNDLLSVDNVLFEKDPKKFIKEKERQMEEAVEQLDFETAALIRDEIVELREKLAPLENQKKKPKRTKKK
jgi:excinuclease ABC subunit B